MPPSTTLRDGKPESKVTEEKISEFLSLMYQRRGDKIYAGRIFERTAISNRVELCNVTHSVRLRGKAICSSNRGYWWGNVDECRAVKESMVHRGDSTIVAGMALGRTADDGTECRPDSFFMGDGAENLDLFGVMGDSL